MKDKTNVAMPKMWLKEMPVKELLAWDKTHDRMMRHQTG